MTYSVEQIVAILKKRQGQRTLTDFAKSLGITKVYLSDIYRKRRDPGPAILEYLGFEKLVTEPRYVRRDSAA